MSINENISKYMYNQFKLNLEIQNTHRKVLKNTELYNKNKFITTNKLTNDNIYKENIQKMSYIDSLKKSSCNNYNKKIIIGKGNLNKYFSKNLKTSKYKKENYFNNMHKSFDLNNKVYNVKNFFNINNKKNYANLIKNNFNEINNIDKLIKYESKVKDGYFSNFNNNSKIVNSYITEFNTVDTSCSIIKSRDFNNINDTNKCINIKNNRMSSVNSILSNNVAKLSRNKYNKYLNNSHYKSTNNKQDNFIFNIDYTDLVQDSYYKNSRTSYKYNSFLYNKTNKSKSKKHFNKYYLNNFKGYITNNNYFNHSRKYHTKSYQLNKLNLFEKQSHVKYLCNNKTCNCGNACNSGIYCSVNNYNRYKSSYNTNIQDDKNNKQNILYNKAYLNKINNNNILRKQTLSNSIHNKKNFVNLGIKKQMFKRPYLFKECSVKKLLT